tara:strand:- start:2787 stop:2978 length:192 start_codon:yes stop_codon:yes gene_type:complete
MKLYDTNNKPRTNPWINTFGLAGLMFLGAVLFAGASAWLYIPAISFILLGQGLQVAQNKDDQE